MTTATPIEQRQAFIRAAERRQAINRKLSSLQAQREALALEVEAWTALLNGLEDHPAVHCERRKPGPCEKAAQNSVPSLSQVCINRPPRALEPFGEAHD